MPITLSRNLDEVHQAFKKLSHPRDIASVLEVDYSRLIFHLHKVPDSKKYTVFEIPKKSGGTRQITAPISSLKILQRKLNFILSSFVTPKHASHGFIAGRSIRTNALVHSRKQHVFTIDLLEFFPCINFGRVRGLFMAPPFRFDAKVATVLAQICTFKNALPQGAPTSPVISNLICRKMDQQLSRLARNYGCDYTRYADDLTFSTKKDSFPKAIGIMTHDTKEAYAGEELKNIIVRHGFAIHPKKVRLLHRCQQQIVTGLVSNEFPNVRRRFIRQVRSMLHAAEKYGFSAAESEFHSKYCTDRYLRPLYEKPSFKKVLKGKIDYVGMIKGRLDPVYLSLVRQLERLDGSLIKHIPSPGWTDEIRSSLFIIDCSSEHSMTQGTGFALKGVGVVTCAHVISGKLEIYQISNPAKKYEAEIAMIDRALDIAILKLAGYEGSELAVGDDRVMGDDSEIILAGFPNYAPGHTGTIKRGRIVASYLSMGMKRFSIDTAIVFGNSGGPVLDSKRRVIGIAVTGTSSTESADSTDKHGVIPISAVLGAMGSLH